MKRLLIILLLFSLSCAPRIRVKSPTLYKSAWEEKKIDIKESKLKDFAGEKLNGYIKWLGMTVGEIEFMNLGLEEYRGRKVYHIIGRARTNRVLRYLFRVQDEFHSYLDPETGKPILFKADRKEGRYRAKFELYFDYKRGKLVEINLLNGEKKERDLKDYEYDYVSAFYKFRTLNLDKNEYHFNIRDRTRKWEAVVKVLKRGKLEMRKHGVFDAVLVEITAYSGREKAKGTAWVWFTADKRKMPLLVQINVDIPIVGTVIVALK
jgi:hypothetical protein